MSDLSALYDWKAEMWEFVSPVLNACPEINSFSDLFVVENLALHPWARRQGVGLRVIQLLLKHWQSGCTLAAIRPTPLQADGNVSMERDFEEYDLGSLPEDVDASTGKLKCHFQKLGFEAIPGCSFLMRSLELRAPSVTHLDLAESLLVPSGIAEDVEAADCSFLSKGSGSRVR